MRGLNSRATVYDTWRHESECLLEAAVILQHVIVKWGRCIVLFCAPFLQDDGIYAALFLHYEANGSIKKKV